METLRGRRDGAPALPCRSARPVPRPGLLPHPLHRSLSRAHACAHIPTREPAFTRVPAAPLLATLLPQVSQRLHLAIQWSKHTSPRPWTPEPEPTPRALTPRTGSCDLAAAFRCCPPLARARTCSERPAPVSLAPLHRTAALALRGRLHPVQSVRPVPSPALPAWPAARSASPQPESSRRAQPVASCARGENRGGAGQEPGLPREPQTDTHVGVCLLTNFSVKPTGKGSNGVEELPESRA